MAESIDQKPKTGTDLTEYVRALPFHKLSRKQTFVLGGGVLLLFAFTISLLANFGEHTAGVRIGEAVALFGYVIWGIATNLT